MEVSWQVDILPFHKGMLSSDITVHNQMTCRVARLSAMYSASNDDKAIVGCFFDCQETGAPAIRNVYPEMDFWSFGLDPQSASE